MGYLSPMSTRNVRPFVHLRVLSSYSLGLGLSTPAEVCRHARRVGFETVALTDVSGTYGFVEFHRAAREAGVKPVYGALLFIDWRKPAASGDPAQSLVLLALDRTGLRNVCAAASISAVERERGEGLVAADLDRLGDGVIAITGVDTRTSGVAARHVLAPLREIFGDRLFLECRAGLAPERAAAQTAAVAEAAALGVAPVLVQDVRFVGPARPQLIELVGSLDARAFENGVFSEVRAGDGAFGHGMMTASEMSEAFDEMPEAYTNAALIGSLVQPDLFDALEGDREAPASVEMFDSALEDRVALRARVEAAFARAAPAMGEDEREAARRRIEAELGLITVTGIESAFVHFEEVVRRLRAAGTRLGPATGLTLQSLCAFLLRITSFDPYAVDRRFEPAFDETTRARHVLDLQIAPEDRPGVLAVINRAFEGSSVGYVPSVEHITAARAIRIVARRLGVPAADYEAAVHAAARHQGASLRDLSEQDRTIGALYRKSAAFRELVAHAASIEGLPYGFARTKRTVIVSPKPLRNFFGYTVSPDTGDHFVQATRDSFPLGAVRRIDVATLNLLGLFSAQDEVWEARNDSVYEQVAAEDLDGVHLLEGAPGRLASTFGIRSFDDLVHFVTLLRDRGSGLSLPARLAAFREPPHPAAADARVGEVLAATQGWLLFTDQLRDVVAALTGLSRADAVRLIARLSDSSPGSLASLRREFFALTVEQSVSLEDATLWFTRIVRESKHVLDRQRVIADCLLVHRCLALKRADRLEFMARLMEHAGDEKRERYRGALEREGKYLPPRVGKSGRGHRVEGTGVRAPLWEVPGVTRETADRIIRMDPPTKYEEFSCAAREVGISLEQIDALERAGAIDSPGAGRSDRRADARVAQADRGAIQPNISRSTGGGEPPSAAAAASPQMYSPAILTPIDIDGNTRGGFRVLPSLLEFYPHPNATPVELAGRIRNLQLFKSSSGQKVGFFELFDSSGSVRVFVPWERVVQGGEPLSDGNRVVVRGKVRQREGRKVCDALEIVVTEGGNSNGETSPDNPPEGDT
jgi:DNA polymerase-3 subunit alpha